MVLAVILVSHRAEAGLRLRHTSRSVTPPASTTPTLTVTSDEAPLQEESVAESAPTASVVTEPETEVEVTTGKHKRGILHGHAHLHGQWPARTYAAHYGYSLQLPGGSAFLAAAPPRRHFVKYGHGLVKPLVSGSGLLPALAPAPAALLPAVASALPVGLPTGLPGGVASAIPAGVATALSTGVATALSTAVAPPSYVLRPGNAVVSSYSVNYPHQHLQKPVVFQSAVKPVHFHAPAHGHVHAVQVS